MVLVADSDGGKQLEVLTVKNEDFPLGALVLPSGFRLGETKQKYQVPDFQKLDLQVIGGIPRYTYWCLHINLLHIRPCCPGWNYSVASGRNNTCGCT